MHLATVQHVITFCGATVQESDTLIEQERLTTLADFAELTTDDVANLAAKLEKRTIANGRMILPQKLIRNLQALCFWCGERVRRGEPLDHLLFTVQELQECKLEMRMRKENKVDSPTIKPEKFTAKKWKTWAKQFNLYLANHKGAQFAPLDYVIRPEEIDIEPGEQTERELQLYKYPLRGAHFREDNMMVYRMLFDLVVGSEGEPWIIEFNRSQNGRAAWLNMRLHYEGGGNEKRKIAEAEATIESLHYKNESIYPFEAFSTKLIEAFYDLENTESVKTPYDQVKILLSKIQVPGTEAEIHKVHVRQHYRADLPAAITYLSTEFARMFPQATFSPNKRYARQIGATDATRPRTSYDMSPSGTDDQPSTMQGITTYFGVDVTDVGRTFSPIEMTTLGSVGQRYVYTERDRLNLNRSRNSTPGRGRGRGGGRFHNRQYNRPYNASVNAITTIDSSLTADHNNGITTPASTNPHAHLFPATLPPVPDTSSPPMDSPSRGSTNGSRFGAGGYRN